MRTVLSAALLLACAGCGASDPGTSTNAAATAATSAASAPPAVARFASEAGALEVATVAEGLEHPWGMTFLPDGRTLVTERPGRLRIVGTDGALSAPVAGVPEVFAKGQGGLLDVALDPDFATDPWVYLSFSEPGEGGGGTAVARGRWQDDALVDVEVIFRQLPKLDTGQHFGSRLVFDREKRLYVTSGDRGTQPNVQPLDLGQGKIFRIERDGGIPADNPFVGRDDALPAIWSYGHRNVQGAALHPVTGALWQTEHGARGGDELNIPEAGKNYGWPVITLGVNYNGMPIGEGKTEAEGMEQPMHQWTPSIAPSGLAFYTADRFPAWQGDLFVGALAFQRVVRLELEGDKVVGEEALLTDLGERIRDVRQGPDGYLYLLTDAANGKLLRVGLAEAD
ncbi:MAG TPA: PQQ-dependent sugar dehydrogenase [Arenimonas sp.]|uniref:PQQ-dependent sugar dehydrogenase n=1 Tax=Arenimonas sp. TaxID=1872635 RepID=UPI002D801244|nr:PQQ-dependent sugar dehydrogenase [Arenimonas sp.]HEU0153784.1 PQQ-dependent sugar dehydrogenase [Arenimonas sp.]